MQTKNTQSSINQVLEDNKYIHRPTQQHVTRCKVQLTTFCRRRHRYINISHRGKSSGDNGQFRISSGGLAAHQSRSADYEPWVRQDEVMFIVLQQT